MSTTRARIQRCQNALEDVLKFVQKKFSPHTLRHLSDCMLSPGTILETNARTLIQEDLAENEVHLLTLIPSLTRYAHRMEFGPHPRIDCLSIASEFLKVLFIGVPIEQFYVLCLDRSGRLITLKRLQEGTFDETPFYLGHLLQLAVTSGAEALVLCHNHPGGTLRPSEADKLSTMEAIRALFPLRIVVLDHIIIAGTEAISMRDFGIIPEPLWVQQEPNNKLLRNWLDTNT